MRRQTLLLLSIVLAGSEPAAAQGFGFLFGEPPPRVRRVRRLYQRHAPEPIDVLLPVPRPHFPGDDGPTTAGQPVEAANPSVSADATKPSAVASMTPPLPPERPGNLAPARDAAPVDKATQDVATGAASAAHGSADPSKPGPSKPEPMTEAKTPTPPPTVSAPTAPLPPEKPVALGTKSAPAVAPSGATTAFNPRDPSADPGCADRLRARGVVAEDTALGAQPDPRCSVVQPMRLVSATLIDGSTVSFPDKPTIACTTADAFSAYVHDLLAPLAKGTWGTGVTSVWTGPGLECRSRDHIFGAKLSAHGQGLAVDIAQLKLGDGRVVAVGDPKTDAERDFETAARAGGCGYFHTVLGPGSDSYHRTHWHLDLEVRGREGDSKYCK